MPPPAPATRQPRLTHFLCIPLATAAGRPQLTESLAAFHADVARTPVPMSDGGPTGPSGRGGRGGFSGFSGTGHARRDVLPLAALRPVGTLHLTLGVMSLTDGPGGTLQRAVERLEGLAGHGQDLAPGTKTTSASPTLSPPSINLRGLHAMQPPSRASVLYAAPVDEASGVVAGGALLQLCERIRAAFSGLLIEENRPLLLHATVVNTSHAARASRGGSARGGRGSRGGRGGGPRGRLTFDARDLVDRYDGHVWMQHVPLETVAICRMGDEPTVVDADGVVVDAAYPVVAAVQPFC